VWIAGEGVISGSQMNPRPVAPESVNLVTVPKVERSAGGGGVVTSLCWFQGIFADMSVR